MTDLPILESPSRQARFDFCRLAGQLMYLDKWEPREADRSLPARLRGTAFSKGAELIHKAIMAGEGELLNRPHFLFQVVDEAVALFDRQFSYMVEQGIIFKDGVAEQSRAELRRVIPMYAHQTPVRMWQQVRAVEHMIPAFRCKPDLVGLNSTGFSVVGDVKYKSSLAVEWESTTIEEYHWSNQFLQYNHALTVSEGLVDQPVYSTLLLVVGSPFRVRQVEWLYPPEVMKLWLASALDLTKTIQDITTGVTLPRAATIHRDKFGWCPMKKACLEYFLDPELMKRDYVQLGELPE